MLVLTQMSVGAFVMEQLLGRILAVNGQETCGTDCPVHLLAAFALGMLGMGASLFHLGRLYSHSGPFIGLLTSWLSREIVLLRGFRRAGFALCRIAVAFGLGHQHFQGASDLLGGEWL